MKLVSRFLILCAVHLLCSAPVAAATVDGIPLHSSVTGTGPGTIIFVHGWTCDDRTWDSQVPELSKKYRVITMDLPGHGRSGSSKDGKLSMALFARAVEAVRREQKVERVVLAGHSMGVMVILQYARLYPQHAAGLVLVDGSVSMSPTAPRESFLAFARQYGESVQAREAMVQQMFTANTADDVRAKVVSMVRAAPSGTPLAAMEAFVEPANWQEDAFPQPVLAVFSSLIPATDRESDPEYMKTRFPKLEYHRMAGTGHFLMLEQAAEFNGLLTSFLDRLKF